MEIDWSKGYPTTILSLNIYQTQNTEIKVKTIGENNQVIANPTGNLTHTIGNQSKPIAIPADNNAVDPFDGLRIHGGNYSNFNGSQESRVSLDGADANGFLVEGDYAYKIIEQKQDDKAEPLEVTIQKKPLVRTENPNDPDYVKIDFSAGDHGSINENKTYWVLKGVDLGTRLSPPEVSPEKNYKFKNWNPDFPTRNQSFNQDTSFTAQYEEDKEPGYGENDAYVKLTIHRLKGKEFPFETIFPEGINVDLVSMDMVSFEDVILGSQTFTQEGQIYFGQFTQDELDSGRVDITNIDPDKVITIAESRIKVTTGSRQFGETGYSIFPIDVYEIQNTSLIIDTVDQEGSSVANPSSKTFTYKIGDIITKPSQGIYSDKESHNVLEDNEVSLKKEYLNGKYSPEISLDGADTNGLSLIHI